jgi:hypothetical protein
MKTSTFTPASKRMRGLALVELVVVLLILALLAGTAITATEGLVEESSYDATRETLERVEEAILGPYAPPTAHDDTLLAGFVADIGRLPRVDGTVHEELLKELWLKPPTVAAFALQAPPGDPFVHVPGGWRGPYLHFGFGQPKLFDGWGRALVVLRDNGEPSIVGEFPGGIGSHGADDGASYSEYIGITIASTIEPVVLPRHLASLPIRLEPALEDGSTASCLVRVYAPVEGNVRAVDQVWFDDTSTIRTHLFQSLPVGPRVVRAYNWTNADGVVPAPEDLDLDPLSPRCPAVVVRLVSGGVPEVVLKVTNPAPPGGR